MTEKKLVSQKLFPIFCDVQVVELVGELTKVNSVLEPGLTLTLGQNLKLLNTTSFAIGKLRLAAGEIDKKMFMAVALRAAENIKVASKCFDKTDFKGCPTYLVTLGFWRF